MSDPARVLVRVTAEAPNKPYVLITIMVPDGPPQVYRRPLSFDELRTLAKDCLQATMKFPVREVPFE